MSRISIANNALMRIGVTRFIESLAEATVEAQVISRVFDSVRRAQLRRMEWSFAKQIVKLALTQYSQKPWQYVYRYPNALRVFRLTDQGAWGYTTNASDIEPYMPGQAIVHPMSYEQIAKKKVPFESLVINEQKVICTDLALASAVVVTDVTDTELFDPLFEELLTWELAKAISIPLSVSKSMAEYATQQAQVAFDMAQAATLDEFVPGEEGLPDMLKARL